MKNTGLLNPYKLGNIDLRNRIVMSPMTRSRAISNIPNELQGGLAGFIAFGRPFINNPDLVERFIHGWRSQKKLDMNTFYSQGEKGYTDYPIYAK